MNKTITIVVIILVVIGGYVFTRNREVGQNNQKPDMQTPSSMVPAPGYESVPEMIVSPEAESATSSVEEISMTSGNLSFSPKNFSLKKNQPVRITFKNTGFHTFTIDELGVDVTLDKSSAEVEFTPTKSGVFEYYCAVPGHRERGMVGTLMVE